MNVYILIQRDSLIKIGKANDIEKRFWQLGGVGRFMSEGHYYVPTKTERDAFLLERCLHRIFAHYQIQTDFQVGHTELFDAHILPKVLRLIRHNNNNPRGVTADEWVAEGTLQDQIGRKTGIWHGCPHYATYWRDWRPTAFNANEAPTSAES